MYPATGTIECGGSYRWMVLNLDPSDLQRYYAALYHSESLRQDKLGRVKTPHVTIVRNELPPNKSLWRTFAGERVTLQYLPGVQSALKRDSLGRPVTYHWLNVVCERFEEIRTSLGLPRNSDGIYHTTIGVTR